MKRQNSIIKTAVFMLLLTLLPLCLAGCGRENAEAVMAKAQESIDGISSMSYDLTMEMQLAGQGESLDMTTTATADYILEPLRMKMDMKTDLDMAIAPGQISSVNMTSYVAQEDGICTMYTGMETPSGMVWYSTQLEDMESIKQYNTKANLDLYLAVADSFEENGTETVSGVETVRYDGIISKDALYDVIETSGVIDQMTQMGLGEDAMDSMRSMLTELDDLPISIWVAKESYLPMKYEMDMTGIMQAMMSKAMDAMGEAADAVEVKNVSLSMTMHHINEIESIEIPEEALASASASDPGAMNAGNGMPLPQVEITDDNYQTLFHVASEMGYEYLGCAYHRAPFDMFGKDGFLDAYLPYGDDLVYSDDGMTVQSTAHGMQVIQTIRSTEGNAKDVVDQAYQELVDSGMDFYEEAVSDTEYDPAYDVACKQIAFLEADGTLPRFAFLYADCKQENYYLYAQITYLTEQLDDDYPAMLEELGDAFGMNLPQYDPYTH